MVDKTECDMSERVCGIYLIIGVIFPISGPCKGFNPAGSYQNILPNTRGPILTSFLNPAGQI